MSDVALWRRLVLAQRQRFAGGSGAAPLARLTAR